MIERKAAEGLHMATVGSVAAPKLELSRAAFGGLAVGAAIVIAARVAGVGDVAVVQTFTMIFTAIVVEALPFVLVGALVASVIEIFVPESVFERAAKLPVGLQLPVAALGGFVFPVCECGSVPVARRLIARGLHPAAGITFMLASPVLNPVVLAATWVAYSPRGLAVPMVAGRAGLGIIVALVTGWSLGSEDAKNLLRSRSLTPDAIACNRKPEAKWYRFIEHLTDDFFFMGRFLLAGAALAAALQSLIPQSLVSGLAGTPTLAIIALMAVAFISSLCSEADAFVAVSFGQFSVGSQLAFLVFGPILDFKLTFLYGATFRRRLVLGLAVVSIPVIVAGSLWFEVFLR
jgi:uncharacterized membrane protein YraQ (UPF0718 family)